MRKSLLTAKQFRMEELDLDISVWKDYTDRSREILDAFLAELATAYRYRSPKSVLAKALAVPAHYPKDGSEPIKLLATNRKKGGVWDALANTSKSLAVTKLVPFEASDEELGLAVRKMLEVSTLSGEHVDM